MKSTLTQYKTVSEALKDHTSSPQPDQDGTKIVRHVTRRFPTATHIVIFSNLDFSSSEFGKYTAMVIGPDQTYKSLDQIENYWLHDLPSRRQYPVAYIELGGAK